MAEEKQPSKLQIFFVQHGEKVGLALALAVLVIYVALFVVMAEEDPIARNTSVLVNDVKTNLNSGHDDKKPGEARQYQDEALSPWQKLPQAKDADNWAASFATKGKAEMIAKTVRVETPYVVPGIDLSDPAIALDGVRFTWEVEEIDTKRRRVKEAEIDHYLVKRRKKGGAWDEGKKIPGDQTSYHDSDIEPKTEYEYKFTPVTKEYKYFRKNNTYEGKTVGPIAAKTLGIYELRIISAVPPQVYIELTKFESGVGKVKKSFLYKPGDKIGSDPRSGSFEHRVPHPSGRGTALVNFDCGFKLLSVKEVKLELERVVCHDQFDKASGARIGCKQTKEPFPFSTKEIVYKDDRGDDIKIYYPEPEVQDVLCGIEHKGDGARERPVKEADPDKEAAKKREDEARDLLKDADKTFHKDEAAAKAIYKKLKAEFSDTKIYQRNKKKIDKRAE